MGGSTGHSCNSQVVTDYEDVRQSIENNADGLNMVYQNTHVIGGQGSLFYTPVTIGEKVTLGAMLDSGSMACTLSDTAEMKLRKAGVVDSSSELSTDVVLVGCGGLHVKPKSVFNLTMEV